MNTPLDYMPVDTIVMSTASSEALIRTSVGWEHIDPGFDSCIPIAHDLFEEAAKDSR